MTKLEHLYELALNEHIDIHFFDLKEIGLLGLNVSKENMPHMIFLDHSVKKDTTLHLNILAHELGHYFTSFGNSIAETNYIEKVLNNKCENKADRWACEFLIREDELIDALNKNINCIHDLAEYLDVDVEILLKRLEYLALQKPTLRISDTKQLILTNLPNIYLYEDTCTYL